MAFRTMQILGQLLKNFPGTLTGDQKERIAEAVFGVGLRTLGSVHSMIRENPGEHAEFLLNALKREHPEVEAQKLFDLVRNTVHWQLFHTTLGVTQRAAADVGGPHLELVFSRIEDADPIPAIRLLNAAVRLDRAGAFPEQRVKDLVAAFQSNPLALGILRALVVTHFHLFSVQREVKQRVCKLLGIRYKPELPRSRRRLIAPKE